MASEWELIASRMSVSQIRDYLEADSLGYSSLDGLVASVGLPRNVLCLACFNGDYPLPVQIALSGLATEN